MSGRADVTVITATIPGRSWYLERAIESVYRQTVAPESHLICARTRDTRHREIQISDARNAALAGVSTQWTAFLDDDNEWLEHHLETLLMVAGRWPTHDVIYLPSTGTYQPYLDTNEWSAEQIVGDLAIGNWIDPNGAMVRTEMLFDIGGFSTAFDPWYYEGAGIVTGGFAKSGMLTEDADLWMRLALVGARFATIDCQTWSYDTTAPDRGSMELMGLMEPPA